MSNPKKSVHTDREKPSSATQGIAGGPRIVFASDTDILQIWSARWGLPIVTPGARYSVQDVAGLLMTENGQAAGLVTWCVSGHSAEVVSLDALIEGRGVGSQLLAAAERQLLEQGVERVHLITTNDNLRAFGFYLRRGYRLVRIYPDGMDAARSIKPEIPELGNDGIPLRDLWELEKRLKSSNMP